nr:thioesterase domain-containing protein [Dermacoccus sp. Tok2021]
MIPSRFEVLDRLPLTPNGKVDRATLAVWAEQTSSVEDDAVAGEQGAATDLEARLAAVYGEVLRETNVPLEASFYALGGDSLLAAQVVTALRERVEQCAEVFFDELLRELLNGASVRELSTFLGESEQTTDSLDEQAAYVLSGATTELGNPVHVVISDGLSSNAASIAAGLGERDPVVLVPPVPAAQGTSIDDLAQEVVRQVRALAPGPFHLVGAHSGGVLALAVAQQLTELGAPVCGLTVLSSFPLPAVVNDEVLTEALFVLGRGLDPASLGYPDVAALGAALGELAPSGVIPAGALEGLAGSLDPHLRAVADSAAGLGAMSAYERRERIAAALGSRAEEVERELARGRALAGAAARHDPGLYTGETRLLLHSEESPLWPSMISDMEAYWEAVCVGGISRTYVPGDHFSCRDRVTPGQIDLHEGEA